MDTARGTREGDSYGLSDPTAHSGALFSDVPRGDTSEAMLLKIAIGLGVALVLFLVYVAMQPGPFAISRSIEISAPPEKIFPLIEDFHEWAKWSPYEKLDPNMTKTFSGAPKGPGAVYEWDGNGKAGKGKMELTSAETNRHVSIKLDFSAPMKATNFSDFTIEPNGATSTVTWSMKGNNGFAGKLFATIVNMDKLLGGDFEKGLALMKAQAEAH